MTGEDVDCSHCRCDPWRTNKLSERGKDKWMKERGVKGKKSPRHVTQNKNEVYNEAILNKEGSLCMSYTDAAVMSHLF